MCAPRMHNVCAKERTEATEEVHCLFIITIIIKRYPKPACNIKEKIAWQKAPCSQIGTDTIARPCPVES